MRHDVNPTSRLSIPALEGLLGNQLQTLENVRRLVASGTNQITVWGISGSGKSDLFRRLEDACPGQLQIFDGYEAPPSTNSRLAIRLKPGIPTWAGLEAPSGELFHRGFGKSDFPLALTRDLSRGRFLFRSRDELAAVSEGLSELGLGSTTLVETLRKLPREFSIAEAVASFVVRNASSGGCTAFEEVLKALRVEGVSPAGPFNDLAAEIQAHLRGITPASLRQMLVPEFLLGRLVQGTSEIVFGVDPLPPNASTTIDFYRKIDGELREIPEPDFLLRTGRGVVPEEQHAILKMLDKLIPYVSPLMWSEGVVQFPDKVFLEASFERKMGLYLYTGESRPLDRSHLVYFDANEYIEPLISRCASTRIQTGFIYEKNGFSLPRNTLVYGGGDHTLRDSRSQAIVCMALELELQRLNIPYDVCRGNRMDPRYSFDFDGNGFIAGSLTVGR